MKSDFYQEEKIYHIYTAYNPYEDTIYVGKTCSKDPRDRFRAHLRGECQLTAEDFTEDPDSIGYLLLESLVCTGSDAYRHVVAWCFYFEEQGLIILNAAGTVRATEDLQPKTKAIYDRVCAPFSLEQIWAREVLPLQHPPAPLDYETPQLRHLGIRVPEDTLEVFREFCTKRHLTQREALRLLLLSQEDLCCQKLMASIQTDFAEKDAIIADLKATLAQKKEQIQRARERSRVLVDACQQYARKLTSEMPRSAHTRLKALSFKAAKRTLDFSAYSYPTTSGVEHFQLEHLVYGRGCAAPLFALGLTPDGTKRKLRWYERDSFVGTSLKHSVHSYKSSQWLVGYNIARDGAADLVVALPLGDKRAVEHIENRPYAAPPLHPSIDEIIAAAKKSDK